MKTACESEGLCLAEGPHSTSILFAFILVARLYVKYELVLRQAPEMQADDFPICVHGMQTVLLCTVDSQ